MVLTFGSSRSLAYVAWSFGIFSLKELGLLLYVASVPKFSVILNPHYEEKEEF